MRPFRVGLGAEERERPCREVVRVGEGSGNSDIGFGGRSLLVLDSALLPRRGQLDGAGECSRDACRGEMSKSRSASFSSSLASWSTGQYSAVREGQLSLLILRRNAQI